tara:strand:+ start:157 stop:840 length:684 start_codon:yes stop_codon:yes gene_type:complete
MNTPTTFQLECLLDRVYENSEASEDLWDKGFLESVLEQRKKRPYLSESQIRTIDKIQAKYTDVAIAEKQHWKENWSDYHRDLCLKAAHYYKANPPYYGTLVNEALSDKENFFFVESDFLKFTNNKYSLKVLKNYEEELKFNVGDTIQIRATNRIDIANSSATSFSYPNRSVRRKMVDKVGFVIKADAKPVTRAARGSRIYQILITGEVAPIYAHESDLKRAKKCLGK